MRVCLRDFDRKSKKFAHLLNHLLTMCYKLRTFHCLLLCECINIFYLLISISVKYIIEVFIPYFSYSLTLVDSLDTLAVLGNYTEFRRVAELLLYHLDFEEDINVSVFETNIRGM